MEEFISAGAFAERVGMSDHAVRQMCKRGDLPAVKVGGRWRIRADALGLDPCAVACESLASQLESASDAILSAASAMREVTRDVPDAS